MRDGRLEKGEGISMDHYYFTHMRELWTLRNTTITNIVKIVSTPPSIMKAAVAMKAKQADIPDIDCLPLLRFEPVPPSAPDLRESGALNLRDSTRTYGAGFQIITCRNIM
ncbi:hypothetical protein Btru_004765 [Bulinus truncatus]|nr:hypothetical protein Btru_004765 [Bulinus truncatus]